MELFSDCESIRTEDFASKFCEYTSPDTCKDSGFEKSEQCATPTPNDEKYSDFSSQKPEGYQLTNSAKQSSTKPCFNQKLDLESIATELFENQLQNYQDLQMLSSRSGPTESSNTSLHLGNLANVQPMRRDIMNKFLSKYSLDEIELASDVNYLPLEHKQHCVQVSNAMGKCASNKKEVNWKTEFNRQVIVPSKGIRSQSLSNSELACDIRQKSLKIQNEIHEERKRKLESINETQIMREHTPREQLNIKVKELDQLTNRMRMARAEREKISEELNVLRNKLKNKTNELRSDQRQKNNKIVPDQCGSFTVPNSNQPVHTFQDQMNQLNAQLNEKKLYLEDLENRIRQRLLEIQDLESIGLSKQDIHQVIEERNGLYEILRRNEEKENDRYELEKKLTETKEELSFEHKRSREKIMKLEEELYNGFQKISGLYEENERISKEMVHFKAIIQKQQDDIEELYTERNELRRQMDKYKEEIESERCTSRDIVEQEKKRFESHLTTEEAHTKMIINDFKSQLSTLQIENNANVEKSLAYKSKVSQLENECQKLKYELEQQDCDFKEKIDRIVDEKNQTIEQFRRQFYTKKENEIQTLKFELDSEQVRTIDNLKECYKQQITDLQMRLENKSQEALDFKSEIRRIKQDFVEKEKNFKSHYETEIMRLKDESKRNFDNFEKKKWSEMEECKEKYEGLVKKMNNEIEEERGMNDKLKTALEKSNKDLVQEAELTRKLKNDKTAAISKLKETAREKLQEEQKHLKDFYEKELEDQLKIIENKMQEKNSLILSKSKEIKSLQVELMETRNTFTSNLSVFFEAIHYQCSWMANEGKFIAPSFKNIKFNETVDAQGVVQQIIKNFQICCQEYSQYFHELIEKVKEEKDASVKVIEEMHSLDIQVLKEQILKDQADELNTLNMHHREELCVFQQTHQEEIERLRRNVKNWKQKTADRLAQKLQKEFHKEIEKKSMKQDINKQTSISLHSFQNEFSPSTLKPIGLIEDLQSNIRQLRDENLSLRKVIVGQNVSHSPQYNEKKDSDYSDQNGSMSRPHSVALDGYKNRHTAMDDSLTRSCSYRVQKE